MAVTSKGKNDPKVNINPVKKPTSGSSSLSISMKMGGVVGGKGVKATNSSKDGQAGKWPGSNRISKNINGKCDMEIANEEEHLKKGN